MTDASRLRFVGGAAILAGALAAGAYYGTRDRVALPSAPVLAPPLVSPIAEIPRREPAPPERPAASTSGQAPAQTPAMAAVRPEARPSRAFEAPRFDVVRMGARGMMVVAGRAAPGAEVLLYEGGREIGRARADSRGEWVILPSDPLGAGARELSLRARLAGGEEVFGPDTVLVVGPSSETAEPQTAQAPIREEPAPRAARRDEASQPAEARGQARDAAPVVAETSPAQEEAAAQPATRTAPARPEQALVLLLPPTSTAAPRALSGSPAGDAPAATPNTPGSAPANTPLGLDVVDYDDSNTMRFAGTAPPGAQLRVYSDDRHLGDATADPAGRWSMTPAEAPPVGRHTLRVDQIGASAGARPEVSGRIEVAFQRESLPPGAVRDGKVVVQPGNNLWRIARDAYGRGVRYTVIYRANQGQIRNPARIYPGQVFAVPEPR